MREPNWITKEECLSYHESLLARFGGAAGTRDEGLLDSALNRPLHLYHYEQPDLFELATAYASGIVRNHPFLDGNKRTGMMAAVLFLETNGLRFEASEEDAAVHFLALADGRLSDKELCDWLARSCSAQR